MNTRNKPRGSGLNSLLFGAHGMASVPIAWRLQTLGQAISMNVNRFVLSVPFVVSTDTIHIGDVSKPTSGHIKSPLNSA